MDGLRIWSCLWYSRLIKVDALASYDAYTHFINIALSRQRNDEKIFFWLVYVSLVLLRNFQRSICIFIVAEGSEHFVEFRETFLFQK